MKHLRKIFEGYEPVWSEEDITFIRECFLNVIENSNFEVNFQHYVEVETHIDLELHIELGKKITTPTPLNSNVWIGMVEVDLELLRNKSKVMLELFDDIEEAIDGVNSRFENVEIKIETNRREQINILISTK